MGARTAGVYQRVRRRPLDPSDGPSTRRVQSSRGGRDQVGGCDNMNRMIAPARQPAPMIAATPPANASRMAR